MKTHMSKYNDHTKKRRFLFFNIGLCLALAFTITAFEWEFEGEKIVLGDETIPDSNLVFILPTRIEPPTPPEPAETRPDPPSPEPDIVEVTDNPRPEPETNDPGPRDPEDMNIPEDIPEDPAPIPDPEDFVDVQASPEGGYQQFSRQIRLAVEQCLGERERRLLGDGTLKIGFTFVVNLDGEVSDVKPIKGFTEKVNAYAMEAILNSGTWTPALLQGRRVPQLCRLPIIIRMKDR